MAKLKPPPSVPTTKTPAQTSTEQQQLQLRQTKDFISRYATNIQFDLTVWGMRMIFGEYLIEQGRPVVDQHTSINMPWLQAKLLLAYLELNLLGYETEHGQIKVPSRLLPIPAPPPEELKTSNPEAYEMAKRVTKTVGEIRAKLGMTD